MAEIIRGLYSTSLKPNLQRSWSSADFEHVDMPGYEMHFAPWIKEPRPGMIVLCLTSAFQMHDWVIAEVVRVVGYAHCVLRDLNTGKLLDMSNESFVPIVGLTRRALWTDDEFEFNRKVEKAFRRLGDYYHVYGGVDFADDKATIWVRKKWGGMNLQNRETVPYSVEIQWNKRTTIKAICEALQEAGYAEREFDTELDLPSIGHNVEHATLHVERRGVKTDVCEFSVYRTESGQRLCLFMETGRARLEIDVLAGFRLDVLAKNDERFTITASGSDVLKAEQTDYYKHGVEVLCKAVDLVQVE